MREGETTVDPLPSSRTPVATVVVPFDGLPREVILKLEGCNPSGSVKHRTALYMLDDLERSGRLQHGSTLVESTSGNLGIAIAEIAAERGYRFIAVVDPKTTPEALAALEAAGAEVDMVERPDAAGGYLLTRLERVVEVLSRSPAYVWTNQYGNASNPAAHRTETGPEIVRDAGPDLDAVFVAVSTGGTLAGIAAYFRSIGSAARMIGVDVRGSVVFGDAPAKRWLTGIGSSRGSSFLEPGLVDGHVLVDELDAIAWCRAVAAAGIELGGSSGAVLAGCAEYLRMHPEARRVLCLCADFGARYRSTIYDDAWVAAIGSLDSHAVPSFDLHP